MDTYLFSWHFMSEKKHPKKGNFKIAHSFEKIVSILNFTRKVKLPTPGRISLNNDLGDVSTPTNKFFLVKFLHTAVEINRNVLRLDSVLCQKCRVFSI